MANVPALLRDGRYRVVSIAGDVLGRCPWCSLTVAQRIAEAQGVLGNGVVLPVRERLFVCTHCSKASVRSGTTARFLGGLGTLLLCFFTAPLFGGALYFSYAFIVGWLRDDNFDAVFGMICLGGLVATSIGTWIPLRRFIDAVRPGAVRVEAPVDIAT